MFLVSLQVLDLALPNLPHEDSSPIRDLKFVEDVVDAGSASVHLRLGCSDRDRFVDRGYDLPIGHGHGCKLVVQSGSPPSFGLYTSRIAPAAGRAQVGTALRIKSVTIFLRR